MSFKREYPHFAPIEQHIRRAHAERAVAIATLLAEAILAVTGAVRRFAGAAEPKRAALRKPLVVKADVARAVPRY